MGITVRSMASADQVEEFPLGREEVVTIAGRRIGRRTLQPGWRWSESIGQPRGSAWCEVDHVGYVASGRFKVALRDGGEFEAEAGDALFVPAGHDGWVLGSETVVLIEILG